MFVWLGVGFDNNLRTLFASDDDEENVFIGFDRTSSVDLTIIFQEGSDLGGTFRLKSGTNH